MKALWNKLFVPALVIAFGVSAVNVYADDHSKSGSSAGAAKSQPASSAKSSAGKSGSAAPAANHTGSTSSKSSTGSAGSASKAGNKTDPKADPKKGNTTSGNSGTSKKSDTPWGGSKGSSKSDSGYGGTGSVAESTGESKKTTPSTGSKGSTTPGKKDMPKKDAPKGGTTTQKDKTGKTDSGKKDMPKKDSKGGTTTQKDKPGKTDTGKKDSPKKDSPWGDSGNKTDKTGTSTSKKDSPWGDHTDKGTKTSKMDPCPKEMPKHKTGGGCWTQEQCKPNWSSCASYNKWSSCPDQWHVSFRNSYCLPTNYCYWQKKYFDARCGCYTYYDSYSSGWYYYEPVVKCYIPVTYCEQYAEERTEVLEECDVCEVEVPVCETVRNYTVLPVRPTCQPYNYGCRTR